MSTFTSTFTASNGTQSKTLVHEFNVTAASGFQIVEMLPYSASGNATTSFPVSLTQPVQTGDTIIVSASVFFGAKVSTITDDASNSYAVDRQFMGSNSTDVEGWRTVVGADGAAPTLSIKPSASARVSGVVYVLRGQTLTPDAANQVVNSVIKGGGATFNLGPFATSGPAFALLVMSTWQNVSGANIPTLSASDFTPMDEAISPSSDRGAFSGHAVYDAATTNITQDVTAQSGSNTTVTRAFLPYTLS